jgi:hypothetical protein
MGAQGLLLLYLELLLLTLVVVGAVLLMDLLALVEWVVVVLVL